jgi:alpha-galactosidase
VRVTVTGRRSASSALLVLTAATVLPSCGAGQAWCPSQREEGVAATAAPGPVQLVASSRVPVAPRRAPTGSFYLMPRHVAKCARVDGASLADGAPVTLGSCTNQPSYRWRLIDVGGGAVFLVADHSGKCLHVHGGGPENDALISQWTCLPQDNVRWQIDDAGGGYVYLVARHSKSCLHVNGFGRDEGARMSQWTCVDQENEQWRMVPVE